jgi:hypothetical protein
LANNHHDNDTRYNTAVAECKALINSKEIDNLARAEVLMLLAKYLKIGGSVKWEEKEELNDEARIMIHQVKINDIEMRRDRLKFKNPARCKELADRQFELMFVLDKQKIDHERKYDTKWWYLEKKEEAAVAEKAKNDAAHAAALAAGPAPTTMYDPTETLSHFEEV